MTTILARLARPLAVVADLVWVVFLYVLLAALFVVLAVFPLEPRSRGRRP